MAKIEIDMLDTALDNSGDGENEILGMVDEGSFGSGGDEKNHLLAQTFLDSGEDDAYSCNDPCPKIVNAVTYRLVQVGADDLDNSASATSAGQIFNTPGGATIERATTQPVQTVLANSVNGQLYVFGNPNEVYVTPGTKTILPRESNSKTTNVVKKRDDRRRATHNEVERRRRDKINNWIIRLSKIIPASQDEKNGIEGQSKGGILAKACEYIVDLKNSQQRLTSMMKDNELMAMEIVKLNQDISTLKRENSTLRNQLTQNGIAPLENTPDVS